MAPTVDKKIMAEKIAKVKEFVHGINQNDIVLALHSFDLDVEKTIQALCENRSAVLDEWECTGAAKKQKTKPSKKKAGDNDSVTTETPSVSSKAETIVPTIALTSNAKKPPGQSNGYHPSQSAKENGMGEMEWLNSHEKEATQIGAIFAQECKRGLDDIHMTFKALRQALADREQILVAAVHRSQQEGEKLINENKNTAKSLLTRMRAVRGDPALNGDLKAFGQARRLEQQLALITSFSYDMTHLIDALNKFGSVGEAVPGRGNSQVSSFSTTSPSPIRHAASHSSIISSDHDSGLGGHISPVSVDDKKQHAVATKPVTQLNAGGLQMASDGLSAEQLEQLQKDMQAQLAASGIDASVVAGGVSNGIIPARPRRDRPNNNNNNAGKRQGGAERKANGPPGPKKNEKAPAISILG